MDADHAPDHDNDVTLEELLCAALDGDDPVRLHLMAALFLSCDVPDRTADLDSLRREGITKVIRL